MKHKLPIYALIVTYNRIEYLKISIQSYSSLGVTNIIIVDNDSSDGSNEYLEEMSTKLSNLTHIRLNKNLGGAGGFHYGMKWIDNHIFDEEAWILIHDDDAFPAPSTITRFRDKHDSGIYNDCVAVACSVLDGEGQPADINRPILNLFIHPISSLKITLLNLHSFRDLYHVPNSHVVESDYLYRVDGASFVGLFVSLGKLPQKETLRYPEKSMFIYGDDTVYTLNLSRNGFNIMFDSSLKFFHHCNTGHASGLIKPSWKYYYLTKNSLPVYKAISNIFFLPLFCFGLVSRLTTILRHWRNVDFAPSLGYIMLAVADIIMGRATRTYQAIKPTRVDSSRKST